MFLAEIFGYLLNFLYDLLHSYGISIIIFSIIVRIILIPITINQQKSMKKTNKIQKEIKENQNTKLIVESVKNILITDKA